VQLILVKVICDRGDAFGMEQCLSEVCASVVGHGVDRVSPLAAATVPPQHAVLGACPSGAAFCIDHAAGVSHSQRGHSVGGAIKALVSSCPTPCSATGH